MRKRLKKTAAVFAIGTALAGCEKPKIEKKPMTWQQEMRQLKESGIKESELPERVRKRIKFIEKHRKQRGKK